MPASLKRIQSTGGLVLVHKCDTPGCEADASFGFGVSMRLAMNLLAAGNPERAKPLLGIWFCADHRALGLRDSES